MERLTKERATRWITELALEALPPELAHLAEGLIAEAIVKAVEFAQHTVSETTDKIYADAALAHHRMLNIGAMTTVVEKQSK